jgi:vacuolar-type H+-ATPase subunit I/STV1
MAESAWPAGFGGYSDIFSICAAVLILVFGHTINMLLIAMSVIVHGIRLNILEFSGHMNMQWSGIPYRPFGGDGKKALHGNTKTSPPLVGGD